MLPTYKHAILKRTVHETNVGSGNMKMRVGTEKGRKEVCAYVCAYRYHPYIEGMVKGTGDGNK